MDKGAVDITVRSEKGKNMLLFRVPHCLPLLDINECTTHAPKHDCHKDADCTNTEGSFNCTCKSGYVGDGKTCTEGVCSEGGKECVNGGTCDTSSTPTKCKCADGYTGDTCQNVGSTVKISAYLMAFFTFFVIL